MLRAPAGLIFAIFLVSAGTIYGQEVPRDCDLEFPAGTNTKAHVLQVGYVLNKYVSVQSTAWIAKPVDNVSGRKTDTDYRWQFDVSGKF